MGQMPQSRNTDWQIGYKVKTHQCAVFRKLISHARTQIAQNKGMVEDEPSNGEPKKPHKNKNKKNQALQS